MDILVAEDEELARESLCHVLKTRPDVNNVFSVGNGNDVLTFLKDNSVDLILLDIQMPGCSGIDVVKKLPLLQNVIFTTAYDHFAVKAFELNAIDYILKPFSDIRLFEALDKVIGKSDTTKISVPTQTHSLNKSIPSTIPKRLVLRESKKVKIIDFHDIAYIKGAGNYVEIVFLERKAQLFRETLGKIEEQLHGSEFVRIHKSTIVRSDLIVELASSGKGDYIVILKTGEQLVLSRRYKSKLFPLFEDK